MERFFYKAKNTDNKVVSGYIRANDYAEAAEKIERKGFVVLNISEEISPETNIKISVNKNKSLKDMVFALKEKKEFFNSFLHYYSSGTSVLQTFKSIYGSTSNIKIRLFCAYLINKTEQGTTLKEAISDYQNILGKVYSMLIVSGEASGKLDIVLDNIVKYIKKEQELKSSSIKAFMYPSIIITLAIAVFLFFKFGILKVFLLIPNGICPSASLRILLLALFQVLIVLFCILGVGFYIYKSSKLSNIFVKGIYNIKLVQKFLNNYYFAKYFNIFALSLDSGISAVDAIELANSVIPSQYIYLPKMKKVYKMVQSGCDITTAYAVSNVLGSEIMSQIAAGEKSGELDKAAYNIANEFEIRMDIALEALMQWLKMLALSLAGLIVLIVGINAMNGYFNMLGSL